MLPFQRILFPIDYSEPCTAVAPCVRDTVQHFKAELTLVHAYGPSNVAYSEFMVADDGWREKMQTFEENRMKQFASEFFPARHVELRAVEGEAGTVIRTIVEREGTDLVMMPTRGQGPLRRFLIGSVTAKVLHDISAAVWTGTSSALEGHQAKTPWRSILCALDGTDEAEVVLKAAASLACSYRANLFLVQAVPTPPMALEIDFQVYRKELMKAADVALGKLKAKLGINAPHTITGSMMIDAVREEALRHEADLVVVGRGQSQGAIARIWSNLYPLIRESPCPVLSI